MCEQFKRPTAQKPSQVEVLDGKLVCPDRHSRKMSMARHSQMKSSYVKTFARSLVFPDRVILKARHLLCVHFGLDISTIGLGPQPGFSLNKQVHILTIESLASYSKLEVLLHLFNIGCGTEIKFYCLKLTWNVSEIYLQERKLRLIF